MGCVCSGMHPRTYLQSDHGDSFANDHPISQREGLDSDDAEINNLNKGNTKPVLIADENSEPDMNQKVNPADFVFLKVGFWCFEWRYRCWEKDPLEKYY